MTGPSVVIIGGGVSGLAAAYEFRLRGVPFLLVESRQRPGGLVVTDRTDGYLIDAGPDALLTQKPAAVSLCRELGLGEELRPQLTRRTFLVRNGRLRALPDASVLGIPTDWRAFAATRAFSTAGKLRMASEYVRPSRPSADDESIASFIGRRFGQEAVEYLADPLLAGIHGGSADRLSMRALFPRFLDLERKGSVIAGLRRMTAAAPKSSGGPFVSLAGGVQSLVDALVAALPSGSIQCGAAVQAIERGRGYTVHLNDGRRVHALAVFVATPPYASAPLLGQLDPALGALCARVPDASVVTVALGYRREDVANRLDGTGFVVPRSEGATITAASWVSSKWGGRAPEGRVLLRAYLGGARDAAAIDATDNQLVCRTHGDLAALLGITGRPVLSRVYRWRRASAQIEVGHQALMRDIDARLASMAGVFVSAAGFRGTGIADCVTDARSQAAAAAAAVTEALSA